MLIVKSGALAGKAEVIDLKDHERALVWIDGRFNRVLGPGLYVYWNDIRNVRVEIVTIDNARLVHNQLASIVRGVEATRYLASCKVERDHVGFGFWMALCRPASAWLVCILEGRWRRTRGRSRHAGNAGRCVWPRNVDGR